MKKNNLTEKLDIVKHLFTNVIYNKKTDTKIDNEGDYVTRAFDIAYSHVVLNKTITKDDLRYINEIITKLVNILGTDWTMINKTYVSEKLSYQQQKLFIPTDDWIRSYKDLIKILNN